MYHVMSWECKSRIFLLHKWIASHINMEDQLLVPQCIVYKGVTKEVWTIKADINSVMMKSVKQSNRRCKVALEENKERKNEKEKKNTKEMHEVTALKKKALQSLNHAVSSYDGKIEQ